MNESMYEKKGNKLQLMFYLTKLLNEFQASQSFTHDEEKLGHYNKDFGDGIARQGYASKDSYQTDIPGGNGN